MYIQEYFRLITACMSFVRRFVLFSLEVSLYMHRFFRNPGSEPSSNPPCTGYGVGLESMQLVGTIHTLGRAYDYRERACDSFNGEIILL